MDSDLTGKPEQEQPELMQEKAKEGKKEFVPRYAIQVLADEEFVNIVVKNDGIPFKKEDGTELMLGAPFVLAKALLSEVLDRMKRSNLQSAIAEMETTILPRILQRFFFETKVEVNKPTGDAIAVTLAEFLGNVTTGIMLQAMAEMKTNQQIAQAIKNPRKFVPS